MTANNPAVPNTRTATPSILRRILVFPFKILWLLIRVAFLLAVIVTLTPVAYGAYRLNQPMAMPEAQGITFRQFYLERYEAYDRHEDTYKVNNNACTALMFMPVVFSVYITDLYAISQIFPDSFVARQVAADSTYRRTMPKQAVTWRNFFPSTWEAFEATMWENTVRQNNLQCRIPPVNFEAARQK